MNENESTPDWLRTTLREAAIRPGLILYGNVRDRVYDPQQHELVTLTEFLMRTFSRDSELGFTLTGVWDQADGLRFANGRMLQRFHDALRPQSAGTRNGATQHYDVGEATANQPAATTPTGLYTNPLEAFSAMRSVMQRGTERPVFLIDWSHLAVTQAANPDQEERQCLLQLGKAMLGHVIAPMDSDHLRQSRGLIVLLAAQLGRVPPVLYQGDPHIRLIAVPTPTRAERAAFFRRHTDDLRCERPRPAGQSGAEAPQNGDTLAEVLADLTDQLTITDLRQLVSLSLRTPQPLPPLRLLNLYRFGDQRSPWEELSEEKLRRVAELLKKRVVGQGQALHQVATMIVRGYMGLAGIQHSTRHSKPKGTLFFVGPTGVGKTELAKTSAEFLFGDESAYIRFDMSEYNHEHSDQRLVGAPPGYVGFEEGGQLTNAVRQRPFSVLLFDEIEKAHPRVLDKFLQILEDGRLTDGRGETAHFSECVIIFTSNIGAANVPETTDPAVVQTHFVRAVEDHFVRELKRPELLNRLGDNIAVFQPIASDAIRRLILSKTLTPLGAHLQERYGVTLRIAPELEERYLRGARTEHGGRGLVNVLERDLLNPLAWFLFERKHQLRHGRIIAATPAGDSVAFDLQEA